MKSVRLHRFAAVHGADSAGDGPPTQSPHTQLGVDSASLSWPVTWWLHLGAPRGDESMLKSTSML